MDSQRSDREWSVQKVLQFIINNCRSWRGEGMKVSNLYTYPSLKYLNPFPVAIVVKSSYLSSTFLFVTADVYSASLLIWTREPPGRVLYSICLATSFFPMVTNLI